MHFKTLVAVALVVTLAGVGCKKDDGPGALPTDEDAIRSAVFSLNPLDSAANVSNSEEYAIDDGGLQNMEYSEGSRFPNNGDVATPINPLRWGRQVQSVSKSVEVERLPGDTLAVAHITKIVAGILHILAIRDSGGVIDTVNVTKAFVDTARRKVLFARIRRTIDPRLNWRPIAISLVEGHSPTDNFRIDSVEVMTPRDTVVVTDPLNTWIRLGFFIGGRGMVLIHPTDSVRIRVTITSQDTSQDGSAKEFVVLHWGISRFNGYRHRASIWFSSQSGSPGSWTRVYDRTFYADSHPGIFNAVIDALSYKTLSDDGPEYSNKFWGKPYRRL